MRVERVLKGRELERVWGVVRAQKVEWVEVVEWVERAGQAEGVGGVERAGEVEWVEWVGKVAAEQAEAAEAEQAATRSLEGYTERTASATSSSRDDCRVGAEPARQAS